MHISPTWSSGNCGDSAPAAVRFLTSLLIECGEIGAVRLVDSGTTVVFEFLLNTSPGVALFREFVRDMRQAYEAFWMLSGVRNAKMRVTRPSRAKIGSGQAAENGDSCEIAIPDSVFSDAYVEGIGVAQGISERVDSIIVERDVATLSVEEIRLMCSLISEEYHQELLQVDSFCMDDESTGFEEGSQVDFSLDALRGELQLAMYAGANGMAAIPNLIGYRDEMQVVVFAVDK